MRRILALLICLSVSAFASQSIAKSTGLPSRETRLLVGICIDSVFKGFDRSTDLFQYGYRQTRNRKDRQEYQKAFKPPARALLIGGSRSVRLKLRHRKRQRKNSCVIDITSDEDTSVVLNLARQEMAAREFNSIGGGFMSNGQVQFKSSVFISGSRRERTTSIIISTSY